MAIVQIYLDHREDIDELRRRSVSENLKIFALTDSQRAFEDASASKKLDHTMYTHSTLKVTCLDQSFILILDGVGW